MEEILKLTVVSDLFLKFQTVRLAVVWVNTVAVYALDTRVDTGDL